VEPEGQFRSHYTPYIYDEQLLSGDYGVRSSRYKTVAAYYTRRPLFGDLVSGVITPECRDDESSSSCLSRYFAVGMD